MKIKYVLILLAPLGMLLSSCTTRTVEPWSDWKERESKREVVYTQKNARFAEDPVLVLEKNENLEPQIPEIDFSVEIFCEIEETKHFERSREHVTKLHSPFLAVPGHYRNEDVFMTLILIPANIIAYPFDSKSYTYNDTDRYNEDETKTAVSKKDDWLSLRTQGLESESSIHIAELNEDISVSSWGKVKLDKYVSLDELLNIPTLTLSLTPSGETQSLDLAPFRKMEENRTVQIAENNRAANEEADRIAAAEAVAAEKAAEERAARSRQFDDLVSEVNRLETAKDYPGALSAQKQVVNMIQMYPHEISANLTDAVKRGIKLASRSRDMDTASEWIKLQKSL